MSTCPAAPGSTAIAARLAEAGVIEHPWTFARGAEPRPRIARSRPASTSSPRACRPKRSSTLMESGKVVLHRLAVPEGLTRAEV